MIATSSNSGGKWRRKACVRLIAGRMSIKLG
jgi:hypothetical protein